MPRDYQEFLSNGEHTDGSPLATRFNQTGIHGRAITRCLNLTGLKTGYTIGTFTGMEEKQVDDLQSLTASEVSDIKVTDSSTYDRWETCVRTPGETV